MNDFRKPRNQACITHIFLECIARDLCVWPILHDAFNSIEDDKESCKLALQSTHHMHKISQL